MRRNRSMYDAWVEAGGIYVRDLNQPGTLSVTNDAENVVADVVAAFGDMRVLYYDTDGNLDELVHDKGTFVRFAPGPNRGTK